MCPDSGQLQQWWAMYSRLVLFSGCGGGEGKSAGTHSEILMVFKDVSMSKQDIYGLGSKTRLREVFSEQPILLHREMFIESLEWHLNSNGHQSRVALPRDVLNVIGATFNEATVVSRATK